MNGVLRLFSSTSYISNAGPKLFCLFILPQHALGVWRLDANGWMNGNGWWRWGFVVRLPSSLCTWCHCPRLLQQLLFVVQIHRAFLGPIALQEPCSLFSLCSLFFFLPLTLLVFVFLN